MKYIFLTLAVLFNISAYIIFRSISGKQTNFHWFIIFSIGLILGAINTFLFTKSLKEINLGIAYPIFSAASITLIIFISVFIFNEKLSPINIIGAFITIVGIILLTR
jgi:multidrug transporter EmrE-like cation transporter